MDKIRCEGLYHTYSEKTTFEKHAIQDVSLTVSDGEFMALIGHTGSGKSTLISHLNGLMKPTAGRIFIDGADIWEKGQDMRALRFKVGLVFQYPEYQLFEETVYKDIAFGPRNMGKTDTQVNDMVMGAVDFVGLPHELLEQSPFELSGGQKRRVAIAGVMAMEPDILILDEPTAGLDPRGRDEILHRIREFHRAKDTTVILVSHSMEDVARVASTVAVMNEGRLFMKGSVDEVFTRAAELEGMGLSIPQVTKVFLGLRARGVPVRGSVYTIHGAVDEIRRLTGGDAPC